MFAFGDFNIHYKDWLAYSVGTDRPSELCYSFSTPNNLIQIVKVATAIPDHDSHSPALLGFFFFFSFLTLIFVPQWLSLHWKILIMQLSRADSDGFRDHLRDVPWEDIRRLGASAAASELCELVQVGIVVYIPSCKYQVKHHSCPWF